MSPCSDFGKTHNLQWKRKMWLTHRPISLMIFHHDWKKMMEILSSYDSIVVGHIATKFCTCHDSTAVVPCAKFCGDHFIRMRMFGREQNEISITFELWWRSDVYLVVKHKPRAHLVPSVCKPCFCLEGYGSISLHRQCRFRCLYPRVTYSMVRFVGLQSWRHGLVYHLDKPANQNIAVRIDH